jgi:hypothetical protein
MKTKHFFLIMYFFDVLTKTRYLNTGFVSLRYKIQPNINQNTVIKLQQNHIFFKIIFAEFFVVFHIYIYIYIYK